MKKGSAGTRKTQKASSAKGRFAAARKRIQKVLARAKKLGPAKLSLAKPSAAASKKNSPRRAAKKNTKPLLSVSPTKTWSHKASREDLPFSYNQTRLEILVRDPEWAYAYWDFSAQTWNWVAEIFRRDSGARPKLRVHNLSQRTSYDLDVNLEAKNWYLNLGQPDTEFEAELGILDSQGRFHLIARSNRIRTPRNSPSTVIDPKWDPSEFSDVDALSMQGL